MTNTDFADESYSAGVSRLQEGQREYTRVIKRLQDTIGRVLEAIEARHNAAALKDYQPAVAAAMRELREEIQRYV